MNIHLTANFLGIATSGDAQDVEQTAQNFIDAVRDMIEQLYPLADVHVAEGQHYGPRCTVYGFADNDRVEQRIMENYAEREFNECWV